MLGGEGKSGDLTRDLTEIEEQVLEGIVRIICRDLKPVGRPLILSLLLALARKFRKRSV
jgi:flagellar motor switch protein FliM